MEEAHSKNVRDIYAEYGVLGQTTAGYTPEHNAFIERWFRTNAVMSRCQMQQFDVEETFWEDSGRMATFIYNRVPPAKRTPGKPRMSSQHQQYPDRPYMDMSKIQPFGLKCFVH
jgi:transposase InsO family protein